MFTLTPIAAEQISNAAAVQHDGAQGTPCLRVAAKLEAGEIVYGMGFDEERENDALLEVGGVTVLIAPRSQELLMNTTLDFVELKPGEFQFIFIGSEDGAQDTCSSRSGACSSCGGSSTGGCS